MAISSSAAFEVEVCTRFRRAYELGSSQVDLGSGDIHRTIGGYPGRSNRMPACCHVMRRLVQPGDRILHTPPKGNGASLIVRYGLPRLPRRKS